MDFKFLDYNEDKVINSPYITIKVSYKEALKYLHPLINRLEFQRNTLKQEYYERLKSDIIDGCIMPPITIAFDDGELFNDINQDNAEQLISKHISNAFILDGIQRLNTIFEASKNEGFDNNNYLYASIIISDSMNKLLYRMIILNNGQKPMSARHQIEILVGKITDKLNLEPEYKEMIFTEKTARRNDGKQKIKKDVLSKAYLAYSSSSIHIDNQKIIEDRLNEIISRKIIHSDIKESNIDYEYLIKYIIDLSKDDESNELISWFNNENNLIGLFAGISKNTDFVEEVDYSSFKTFIENIDYVIKSFNISKIKVSRIRREVVMELTSKYKEYITEDTAKLDEYVVSQGY